LITNRSGEARCITEPSGRCDELRSVESRCRSLAGFRCFSFTIPRRGVGHERIEQLACGLRHLLDGAIENFFVCFRRFRKAAELPNELQRRRADLFLRRRRFEVMKGSNISTHAVLLPTINQALRAVWEGGPGVPPYRMTQAS